MSRREEDESRITRKINIITGGSKIAALVPGVSTIEDAWIEYGGVRITEVPVGEKFDIFATYIARNEAGTAFNPWKATVTVIGNDIQNYEDTSHSGQHGSQTVKLDKMGDNIMPDNDITLRFRLWLHDDTSEDYPPIATW